MSPMLSRKVINRKLLSLPRPSIADRRHVVVKCAPSWSLQCKKAAGPQAIPHDLVRWRTVISTRWKHLGEHINVLEGKALCLALRWRTRVRKNLNERAVHLIDSQVVMNAVAKGRTSSRRLRPILQRANALLLASHVHLILGYVRSKHNPADRPSRTLVQVGRGARRKAQERHG